MKRIMILAAACAALVACNKDAAPSANNANAKVVTLCVKAGNTDTKVIGALNTTTNGIDFTWETGDQIKVTRGGSSAAFTLKSGAGESTAVFEGTMPGTEGTFDVQFPYDDPTLSSQTYVASQLPQNMMKATASECSLGSSISLTPAYAALRLNLWGSGITLGKIEVKTKDTSTSEENTYTLDISGGKALGSSEAEATPFFIVVPAGTCTFSATLYDADNNGIQKISPSSSKTFTAGKILNMNAKQVTATIVGTRTFYAESSSSLTSGDNTLKMGGQTCTIITGPACAAGFYLQNPADWRVGKNGLYTSAAGNRYLSIANLSAGQTVTVAANFNPTGVNNMETTSSSSPYVYTVNGDGNVGLYVPRSKGSAYYFVTSITVN